MLILEDVVRQNHNIILENRKKFTLTGIKDVSSFDEETVILISALGKLVLKGANLHILNYDTQSGDLLGEGRIHALIYTADETEKGFFSRIFR